MKWWFKERRSFRLSTNQKLNREIFDEFFKKIDLELEPIVNEELFTNDITTLKMVASSKKMKSNFMISILFLFKNEFGIYHYQIILEKMEAISIMKETSGKEGN